MGCTKIDLIIGIAAFIILAIFFSFQQMPLQERDDIDKNKPTSSGTQTAGDDSEVALPSVGDIPAESEDEEPEPGSPQTGESSLRLTRIYAISALVVAAFYCIKTNNKYIWSGTQ